MDNRRSFISKSATITAGLFFASSNWAEISANIVGEKITSRYKINSDGTFDLLTNSISLRGAYPAIDAIAIKPISIKITENSVSYTLTKGIIKIDLATENGNLKINSSLIGFAKTPHWFSPIAGAKVIGVEKYFYQGIGFGGPSGFADLTIEPYKTPKKTEFGSDETWMLESYLLSTLISKNGESMSIGATDHRNFLQKSTLYNKEQRWGLINRHLLDESVCFDAQFSIEESAIKSGETLKLPDILLIANSSAWDATTTLAKQIALEMKIKPMKEPRYHWCSWYIKQKEFSFQDLTTFLNNVATQNPRPEFQTVQIDDGYQKYYGDWLDFRTELWPGGIAPAFDLIKKKGYKTGVWIGAFMVHKKSKLFSEHPDWCLRKADGSYIEEFGGDCLILDSSHPEAFDYLRSVFKYFRKCGVTFYKTDFMDWGLQDSLTCKRYTPGKTSVQYYREVLQMIREEIGDESYWLACISPFSPFLGFADGVRVGNDTPESWSSTSLNNAYSQMKSMHYANQILFQNDPDVMYLNNKIANYTDAEIQSFAFFCGMIGGSVNTSEWLDDSESIKLWRFLKPNKDIPQAKFPFWTDSSNQTMVATRFYKNVNAWSILITNTGMDKNKLSFGLEELVGKSKLHVYKWSHLGAAYLGYKSMVEQNLGAHESVLYFVSESKNAPHENLTIGGHLN